MHLMGWQRRMELKWLILGILIGGALGYAQGSGMVDFMALLPI